MDKVPSPCVRNCCLNDDDICLGCGRSYQEILDWHGAEDAQRQQILQLASERLAAMARKRQHGLGDT